MQTRSVGQNETLLRLPAMRGDFRPPLRVDRQLRGRKKPTHILLISFCQFGSNFQRILHVGGRDVETGVKTNLPNLIPFIFRHSNRRVSSSLRYAQLLDVGQPNHMYVVIYSGELISW